MRQTICRYREVDRYLGRQLNAGITPLPGVSKSFELGVNRLAIKCSSYEVFDIFCKISVHDSGSQLEALWPPRGQLALEAFLVVTLNTLQWPGPLPLPVTTEPSSNNVSSVKAEKPWHPRKTSGKIKTRQ